MLRKTAYLPKPLATNFTEIKFDAKMCSNMVFKLSRSMKLPQTMVTCITFNAIVAIRVFSQTFFSCKVFTANGPRREKTCLRGFANNTGADQPAHPRSLISAFVIRYLESILSTLATSEISSF